MQNKISKKEVAIFSVFVSAFYFLFTYKSFNNYFYFDDLDTLSWLHQFPVSAFIIDTFDFNHFKQTSFYRPFGSLLHNICYKLFALNFLPYHLVATLIHFFNIACVCLLIAKLVPSKFAVFAGGFLFTFHLTALPIYWYFYGTFDSLAAAFLLLSFLFYIKHSGKFDSWYLASLLCFVFSLRSKEMSLTFPLVLVAFEILVNRRSESFVSSFKQTLRNVWPFLVISIITGCLKLSASFRLNPNHDYSLHFDFSSLLGGLNHFVKSALYEPGFPLLASLFLLAILGILPFIFKSRTLAFSYSLTIISLLPILPLAHRRADFHMYIPLIGVSIYTAELFYCIQQVMKRKGGRFLPQLYVVVIALLILHSQRNWELKKGIEEKYLVIAKENREFVKMLAPYKPRPKSVYYYDSAPWSLRFESGVFAALHLLFHDYTVTTQSIPDCNKNIPLLKETDVFCISFKDRKVKVWRDQTISDEQSEVSRPQ